MITGNNLYNYSVKNLEFVTWEFKNRNLVYYEGSYKTI